MKRAKTYLIAALLAASGAASADWSANVGYASEYYYRGIFQKNSSASAGLDFEQSGFYAGTWAADVGDGLEVDGYFGYGGSIGNFEYGVGYTGYFYTGDFDDTYQEVNLNGAYGIATLDLAAGRYDNFDGPTLDYTYYSLTFAHQGFFGRYAGFTQDFDGSYVEAGYEGSIAEIDFSIRAIFSDEELSGTSDEALVFTIGKTFDLN